MDQLIKELYNLQALIESIQDNEKIAEHLNAESRIREIEFHLIGVNYVAYLEFQEYKNRKK